MADTYQEGDLLRYKDQPLKLFGLNYTELVYVEAGLFRIGDNSSEYAREKPETEITFAKGYFIGKYPVTQQLYKSIMGENPSHFKGNYRPVETISNNDICKTNGFLERLNKKIEIDYPNLQGNFDLPSEAQWEYAARGGQYWDKPKLTYSGSENLNDVGWYKDNSNDQTKAVGLKQPNELELYDMSGNIWEWCADWYVEDYQQIPKDGSPYTKQNTFRVLRGGGCFGNYHCRVAYRTFTHPDFRNDDLGIRLVLPQFS